MTVEIQTPVCLCNGCPQRGAVCGYIIVSSNQCGAPKDYECVHLDASTPKDGEDDEN